MAQRISRAKARLRQVGARFTIPPAHELPDRVAAVAQVLYLIFTEGHTTTAGSGLYDVSLIDEAIRLTRHLHAQLPGTSEISGLLALMLLTDARRAARIGENGTLVPLAEQDRTRWDQAAHRRGHRTHRGRTTDRAGRPVPTAGRDYRRARRGSPRRGHRLAADRDAVPDARRPHAEPDRHAQPRGRGGHGQRARRRPADGRATAGGTSSCAAATGCMPYTATCSSWPAIASRPDRPMRPLLGSPPAFPSSTTSTRPQRGSAPRVDRTAAEWLVLQQPGHASRSRAVADPVVEQADRTRVGRRQLG